MEEEDANNHKQEKPTGQDTCSFLQSHKTKTKHQKHLIRLPLDCVFVEVFDVLCVKVFVGKKERQKKKKRRETDGGDVR